MITEVEDTVVPAWVKQPARKVSKTIWTLNVGNYEPEICAHTYPLINLYAKKIGAEFRVLDERKFPDFPVTYEKMQIHTYGANSEWNLYIDSDTLVHPNFYDPTCLIGKETVLHNGKDVSAARYQPDAYFRRDGRYVGACNWFTVASDWCLDLWQPLDIPLEQALASIYPTVDERNFGITPEHLIDDYTLSRNIARYGLKFTTNYEVCELFKMTPNLLWHQYLYTGPEKLVALREALVVWSLSSAKLKRAHAIQGLVTVPELAWLGEQARGKQNIVEIGSYLGRSTRALADNCAGTVTAIDDFKGPRDISMTEDERNGILQRFQRNMEGCDNVRAIVCDHTGIKQLPLCEVDTPVPPDMIFIDGAHDLQSVKRDVEWALTVIKPGGLLCGHDFQQQSVRQALLCTVPNVRTFPLGEDIWWAIAK
jgi:predicted O-methyltransferase YrrM